MATQALRGSGDFLTRVLSTNGLITGLLGVGILLGSASLAQTLGLGQGFLLAVGAICVAAAALLLWLLASNRITRAHVLALAVGEVIWVVLSFAAVFGSWLSPTPLGWWAIILQADMVAIFAALEFYGLRKK